MPALSPARQLLLVLGLASNRALFPGKLPMHMVKIWLLAIMVTIAISVGGCGGGGAQVKAQTTTTTLGQELQDLDAAYQKGLLSTNEYEKKRKKIMERYNK
jgi:hypothetical protein